MKIIVITGPSGSGKTTLSNNLTKLLDETIVIKTDSYYRDDIFIKLSSVFIYDIYDRIISIKNKQIIKTIYSICNKEKSTIFYYYDFKTKKSTQLKKEIDYRNEPKFLILEGIFAHRLGLNYKNSTNILCKEDRDICYKRRLNRDHSERGRTKVEVRKKFIKSWNLYFRNLKKFINNNHVIEIKTSDELTCKNLINSLNYISK